MKTLAFAVLVAENKIASGASVGRLCPPPPRGRKLRFSAPLDIPDISGYQMEIGCQFVKACNNENPVTNQKILSIRFVSNLNICKIVIVCITLLLGAIVLIGMKYEL